LSSEDSNGSWVSKIHGWAAGNQGISRITRGIW
jgi:hypothetical protein